MFTNNSYFGNATLNKKKYHSHSRFNSFFPLFTLAFFSLFILSCNNKSSSDSPKPPPAPPPPPPSIVGTLNLSSPPPPQFIIEAEIPNTTNLNNFGLPPQPISTGTQLLKPGLTNTLEYHREQNYPDGSAGENLTYTVEARISEIKNNYYTIVKRVLGSSYQSTYQHGPFLDTSPITISYFEDELKNALSSDYLEYNVNSQTNNMNFPTSGNMNSQINWQLKFCMPQMNGLTMNNQNIMPQLRTFSGKYLSPYGGPPTQAFFILKTQLIPMSCSQQNITFNYPQQGQPYTPQQLPAPVTTQVQVLIEEQTVYVSHTANLANFEDYEFTNQTPQYQIKTVRFDSGQILSKEYTLIQSPNF